MLFEALEVAWSSDQRELPNRAERVLPPSESNSSSTFVYKCRFGLLFRRLLLISRLETKVYPNRRKIGDERYTKR